MKILNIHGYRGSAENCACSALKGLGCVTVSPQIDYDDISPMAAMDMLRDISAAEDIGLIVGTSLGGFYAAVLAAETKVPVILVNPCLMPFYHLPKLGFEGDIKPYIELFGRLSCLDSKQVSCIVGGCDEVIDTHSLARSLFDNERFRTVPDGMHSGATLPLTAYFGDILKII